MKKISKQTKKILLIILFAAILYVAAMNFSSVLSVLKAVFGAAMPVLTGLALAFVLNVPMSFLESRVFVFLSKSNHKFVRALKRPVCLTLTVLFALLVISLIFAVLIPHLVNAFGDILKNLDSYSKHLPTWITKLITKYNIPTEIVSKYYFNRESLLESAIAYFSAKSTNLLEFTASFTLSLISEVFRTLLSFIVAVYMLACKEKVFRFIQRVIFNYASKKAADTVHHIVNTAYDSFTGFIVGQFTDSVVLGILCYIGMLIFGFPYAGVVSMVVGAAQLIPIIGGFASASIGTLLMLTESPVTAISFLLFIIIVQQLEGNFVYPRIVGDKVGLPGLVVLSGVIFFGNLFGIPGILLGIPLTSTIFALLRFAMDEKEKLREQGTGHREQAEKVESGK